MKNQRIFLKSLAVSLGMLVLIGLTACPKQDVLRNLAVASREASSSIKLFQDNEIALYNAGLISKEDHLATQQILLDVAQVGLELDKGVRMAQTNVDALTAVNAAIAGLDKATLAIGTKIKDESTKTKFLIAVSGARAALVTMSMMLQGR